MGQAWPCRGPSGHRTTWHAYNLRDSIGVYAWDMVLAWDTVKGKMSGHDWDHHVGHLGNSN
eukprot:7352393-Ditylum_brightwellii.AAC.1